MVCADIFHVVKLVTEALEEMRRELWQTLRKLPDQSHAKAFKGTRWALLKNPADLTAKPGDPARQDPTDPRWDLAGLRNERTIPGDFRPRHEPADAITQLNRWITRALRSRLSATRSPPRLAWS